MKKITHLLRLLLVAGGTAAFSHSASASWDMDTCLWGTEGCMITSPPVLDSANDTRDNLMRLLGEKQAFVLPSQPDSIDERHTRDYYFAWHFLPEYIERLVQHANAVVENEGKDVDSGTVTAGATGASATPDNKPPVYDLAKELGISDESLEMFHQQEDSLETRYVSNNLDSVQQFYQALLADTSLTPQQRQPLVFLRLQINGSAEVQTKLQQLVMEENTRAASFRIYLLAANAFYAGDYDVASSLFNELSQSQQPWLAETSSYMLMRTALNRSTADAVGEYGDFDASHINKESAQQARDLALSYLQKWPSGVYAASARGLLRRIDWYLGNWDQLAQSLEQALQHPHDVEELSDLVAEADNKLLSKDIIRNESVFTGAPETPQLTFIQTLRLMRNVPCKEENQICVDQAYLDNIKPIFEKGQALPLWQYLTLWLAYQQHDYATVLNHISPATEPLPEHDILAFSQQAMLGNTLIAQEKWEEARQHWVRLLTLSKTKEQQQYIQGMLAGVMVYAGQTEQIFAADSPVTNLNYRSMTLKAVATPELLRKQAEQGMNSEEQTIALHTLLMKDLIAGRYSDWLQDKNLQQQIKETINKDKFRDVDLAVFNWSGEQTEKGYYCPTLEKTVTTLSTQPDDSHALNCLGEFFRTTDASVTMSEDEKYTLALGAALEKVKDNGSPDRQSYYMQVMKNPRTEPEDKSFALYRAVMCYAPSGFNDCGGVDQELSVRKGWFNQLKKEFPGGIWTRKLKYYW